MSKEFASCRLASNSLLVVGALGIVLVYLQNLAGPFLFDDHPNIVTNFAGSYTTLNAWLGAALSGQAGPPGRPVAMLSFALNYQLGGLDPYHFKLTNLILHLLCGLLVWRLVQGLLLQLPYYPPVAARLCALATAAVWTLHPIQLTIVLYVVQRMTSLSTLFCLAGMLCYLHGRQRLDRYQPGGTIRIAAAFLLWTPLAALSKENGALLPLYLLLIELCFFHHRELGVAPRRLLMASFACTVLVPALMALVWLIQHWSLLHIGAFREYDYGPGTRLLTQARILWTYLWMILLPDAHWFTLFHDDVQTSAGWLSPWTTLPAVLGIAGLLGSAWWLRRHVAGFGIGLFLAGHLLESTVLPLELMFEHRNHLPALGPLLVLCYYLSHPGGRYLPLRQAVLPVLMLLYVAVSWPRAQAWGQGFPYLSLHELQHSPHSPRLHADLANYYQPQTDSHNRQALYRQAAYHLEACARLEPDYPACTGYRYYLAWVNGQPVHPDWLEHIGAQLGSAPLRPTDIYILKWLLQSCRKNCEVHHQRMAAYITRLRGNPRIVAHGQRDLELGFADYYLYRRQDLQRAWAAMRRARLLSLPPPQRFQTRKQLSVWLSSVGYPALALEELDALTLAHPLRSRTRGIQQYQTGLRGWLETRQ